MTDERYLCFSLGKEEYGVALLSVKEVIGMPEITPVPQSPAYFLGIMNLRGQVISVLDLRKRLGITPATGAQPGVIILDLSPNSIGVVVDSINSVLSVDPTLMSEKPELQNGLNTEYIKNVYRQENRLVLLVDIPSMLNGQEKAFALNQTHPQKKAA